MRRVLVGLVAGLVLLPGPAAAAPAGDEQELVNKVNRAIDRGLQYLRVTKKPDRHWEGIALNVLANMDGGVTALAALAMLNCGATADEKEVKQALDYLRSIEPARTYVAGLTAMALAEARQPKDLPLIQKHVDWLLQNATVRNGKIAGWGYPFERNTAPDGSNTQYALLGLYAGKQAGAKIDPRVWAELQDLYRTTIVKEGKDAGYWFYSSGMSRPSFTMTVAGVSGLVIAGMAVTDSQQKLNAETGVAADCGRYAENDPIARGMNWLGKRFAFEDALESKSTFYNIYGIERVGRLSGQRFIGKVDWYREGCEYLVRQQSANGSWAKAKDVDVDGANVIATSFALLFLSKGRTPVLISKLAHGDFAMPERGVLVERGGPPGVIGWNRKHNDARHLTEYASRELFNGLPLGWQVYDPRRREFGTNAELLAEVGGLVQSPLLYLNGHDAPLLKGQHKEIVKKYVEEGGFVLAEACCGSPEFDAGFRGLIEELFPGSKLRPVPPEHPIWRSYFAVPPTEFPKLECLDRGCRTVLVYSPAPLAGYWEEARFMPAKGKPAATRGERAFHLGANVIAYATGMEPPKQKLTTVRVIEQSRDQSPPKGFLKPAQLQLQDETEPAPAAMRNLMGHLQSAVRLDAVPDKVTIPANHADLFKFKFLYLHGRKRFALTDGEVENLQATLQTGGLLFADACCGSAAFDAGFREAMAKLFPDRKLEPIPLDDDLYSDKLGGAAIRTVKRREKAGGAGPDGGFRDLPPALEGIKLDGRWVVIYSKYDIGCALEGHKATDCLGHTRESALQLGTAAVLYALKK